MRGSRICEYEKWPMGGVRPSVKALKILATIYETSWDQLVDVEDLEAMPAHDRQAYLDVNQLSERDRLGSRVQQYGGHRSSAPSDIDGSYVNSPGAAKELMTIARSEHGSHRPDRLGSEALGEIADFTDTGYLYDEAWE
jgi:hypothetical protein